MRKTLLTLAAAAICCLGAKAQYTADPSANTDVTGLVSSYGDDVIVNGDGTLFSLTKLPSKDDDGNNHLSLTIQILDKGGNKVLPAGGKELDNPRAKSYTVVNQELLADADGNFIVASHDGRNAAPGSDEMGYTAYKVDGKGNVLWQKDLAGGSVFGSSAMMSITQTTDGGYVFAYMILGQYTGTPDYIRIEKLTADGEEAWPEAVLMQDAKTSYGYPYLVDAGDNQFLLIYARGTGKYIEAQLYDFDGTPLWEKATEIYNGGFGDMPLHTQFYVMKAPEGAFVTWSDDRSYEGSYSNYAAYVKRDGTLGLNGTAGGLKISYADEYSRQVPRLYYCEADQSLYAIYRQYSQRYQDYCGIYMQRISPEGELLWGREGKAVVAMQQELSVGYATVQGAGGTDIATFWQTNTPGYGGDTKTYALRSDADGNSLWAAPTEVCTVVSEKNNLLSSQLIDGKYWILTWRDYRGAPDLFTDALYAQRVNADGTLGLTTGISSAKADRQEGPACAYSLDGRLAATTEAGLGSLPKGIYIVKDKATGSARKVTIE